MSKIVQKTKKEPQQILILKKPKTLPIKTVSYVWVLWSHMHMHVILIVRRRKKRQVWDLCVWLEMERKYKLLMGLKIWEDV